MIRIFVILLFFPSIVFASFPIKKNVNDTIRHNGKIFILVDDENSKNYQQKSFQAKNQHEVESKSDKAISKRSKNILKGIGYGFLILSILVIILLVLIVGWLRSTFSTSSTSLYS